MRLWVAACTTLVLCGSASADEIEKGLDLDRVYRPGEKVEIEADSVEWDASRELYVARGNPAVLRQDIRELSADFIAYSEVTRRGVASGNVFFTDGEDTLTASFIEFDIDTLQGVMFDAEFVNAGTLELRGREIQKTGERTYSFTDGEFTSCRCPDDEDREPWQLAAGSADLEVEGYGTVRNTTLEILGVPILWLPWAIFPLKTERQSGLLFPEFTVSGRNGFEIGLPLFLALGDPVNLTFTPRWLQERGGKADVEIEYVLGERSEGDLFGAFIYDTKITENNRRTPFDKERWTTFGEHDFFLPGRFRIRADYAFVSDNAYPNDFDELSRNRRDRYLDSTGFVTGGLGATGALGMNAGARYSDDLQNPDDTDRDDFLIQRLPEVEIRSLPRKLPFADWLVPALDAQYVYFHQVERPRSPAGSGSIVSTNGRFLDTGVDGVPNNKEQGREEEDAATPDPNNDNFVGLPGGSAFGTEGDGIFQEGELLADDGHRLQLHPRLGTPIRLFDALEFYPEVGWQETLYGSDAQDFERRGFFTGRADLRTRVRGDFGTWTHLLEPRLGWAMVSDTSQSGNPLYVPRTAIPQRRARQLQLDNVTRDVADRVREFNGLSFALSNRFFRKPRSSGDAAELLADFVLSGLYDFEESEFDDVFLEGRIYPFRNATARFSLGFDPRDAKVSEGLMSTTFRDDRGDSFSLDYRFLRDIPEVFEDFPEENRRFRRFEGEFDQINQITGALRIAITRQWGVTYAGAYSFERGVLLGNTGGIEFISKCRCWALRFEVRQSRSRGLTFAIRYAFIGIGDDSRTPFQSGRRNRQFDSGFLESLIQNGGF